MVGVILLGDFLQSADNAQNASDAAALAAADRLGTSGQVVVKTLAISPRDRCGTDLSAANPCRHYGWLRGNYIYIDDEWELIGPPPAPISAAGALAYGTASGAWTCASPLLNRAGSPSPYCATLAVSAPGTPGQSTSANGALSTLVALDATNAAADEAKSVLQHYGFTNFSGCAVPQGFLLAQGPTGVTCIGYDAEGTVWVDVPASPGAEADGLTDARRSSWATLSDTVAVLCSGPPPSGDCD